MSKVSKALTDDIAKLVKLAQARGFVTQDEVLDVFVEPEEYVNLLDDFYSLIVADDIDIFESVSDEGDDDISNTQRELDILNSLVSDGSSDPVRMYLKEI